MFRLLDRNLCFRFEGRLNIYSALLSSAFNYRYGDVWGPRHGGDAGTFYTFVLMPNELIIGTKIYFSDTINSIQFITTSGRWIGSYGSLVGRGVTSKHPGCSLDYISGWNTTSLSGIQFFYNC